MTRPSHTILLACRMNVDMIALYSRYSRMRKPRWRAAVTLYLKRIRLFFSLIDGGIRKSYYTFESTEGHLIDLVYNEDELTWHKMLDTVKYSPSIRPPVKDFKLEVKLPGDTYPLAFYALYPDVFVGCICLQTF